VYCIFCGAPQKKMEGEGERVQSAAWSSGTILAQGARGPGFNSQRSSTLGAPLIVDGRSPKPKDTS